MLTPMARRKRAPFPEQIHGEVNPFRSYTTPGRFAYRSMVARELLEIPDLGMYSRGLLESFVIFYAVVALEDLIRELGNDLSRCHILATEFPMYTKLHSKSRGRKRTHRQRDRDVTTLLEPTAVNDLYYRVLGVRPFARQDIVKVRDLALVRHTIAHHGGLFRRQDAGRFQYYRVRPGAMIAPPTDFARESVKYLYEVGRAFERTVRDRIFSRMKRRLPRRKLIPLLEVFNYFGFLIPTQATLSPAERRTEALRVKALLVQRCFVELGI
jgi:hypothetical protein